MKKKKVKILFAVEMKHPDSPMLVTEVDMAEPKDESEEIWAALGLMDAEKQAIEQSIEVTKYQVRGRHKKLKSIRCPHCKFNYTKHGKQADALAEQLKKNRGKREIMSCMGCKELYLVRKKGVYYEMEW